MIYLLCLFDKPAPGVKVRVKIRRCDEGQLRTTREQMVSEGVVQGHVLREKPDMATIRAALVSGKALPDVLPVVSSFEPA